MTKLAGSGFTIWAAVDAMTVLIERLEQRVAKLEDEPASTSSRSSRPAHATVRGSASVPPPPVSRRWR